MLQPTKEALKAAEAAEQTRWKTQKIERCLLKRFLLYWLLATIKSNTKPKLETHISQYNKHTTKKRIYSNSFFLSQIKTLNIEHSYPNISNAWKNAVRQFLGHKIASEISLNAILILLFPTLVPFVWILITTSRHFSEFLLCITSAVKCLSKWLALTSARFILIGTNVLKSTHLTWYSYLL